MKLIKNTLLTLTFLSLVFSGCKKDDNNDGDDNNTVIDPCQSVPCSNGSTCNEGICECTAEWTGKYCDTSAILTPYFKSYNVTTTNTCSFEKIDIQFVPRENETNPIVCDMIVSIGCNFGNDNVVRFFTTFNDNNFTTNTRECRYNNQTEATYTAFGNFTADSVFITINSTYRIAPPQSCTYAGKR